jgi:hypothetical protein
MLVVETLVERVHDVFIVVPLRMDRSAPLPRLTLVVFHLSRHVYLVKARPQVHGQLQFVVTVVALLAHLGFVLLLDLGNLHVRPLQSLVQLLIQLVDPLLLALLLPELRIHSQIVILELLHSDSQELY